MMKKGYGLIFIIALSSIGLSYQADWGFFGHRRINRMAVFTLPQKMFGFYKRHIEFITEHAVDPDKRRYATKHEAVRHYIDLDHWGTFPFDNLPRRWSDVLARYSDIYIVDEQKDTVLLIGPAQIKDRNDYPVFATAADSLISSVHLQQDLSEREYVTFFREKIQPQYYEEEWIMDCADLKSFFSNTGYEFDCQSAFVVDHFSGTGILPYHLLKTYNDLTKAFAEKNTGRILQLSADFGHYLGDAHVPLHTTENYNGQLTNQLGIHAFWESRIPELFADKEYDFFVGTAKYIDSPAEYFWDIVLKSHSYVDSVLQIEKELTETFPLDKQYCFDDRNNATVRTQCAAFARAYALRMEGMVEAQMRDAIYSIGCAWYSAWVDAGQPKINKLDLFKPDAEFLQAKKEEEKMYRAGETKGRSHD